jgi:hypothetical protein
MNIESYDASSPGTAGTLIAVSHHLACGVVVRPSRSENSCLKVFRSGLTSARLHDKIEDQRPEESMSGELGEEYMIHQAQWDKRVKQLSKMNKTALSALWHELQCNPYWTVMPPSFWTKDELINDILRAEFPS